MSMFFYSVMPPESYAKKKATRIDRKTHQASKKALRSLSTNYRKGLISSQKFWIGLHSLIKSPRKMPQNHKIKTLQIIAHLALKAGYPVLAATYAEEALTLANDPMTSNLDPTWRLLSKISKKHPIQYILENIALRIKDHHKIPKEFGNDWNYIRANSYAAQGKDIKALKYYEKLHLNDRYFLPTKYQIAMIKIKQKDEKAAEVALKAILFNNAMKTPELPDEVKEKLVNYAHMALGRLYYQTSQFYQATLHYRKVSKASKLYYDALFEQSWSLFMSGNPLHALGALYGVKSPYFKNKFNPEAMILEAIIYYWICRYQDSRNALADFAKKYLEVIESLATFLGRQHLDPETAYGLFENLISGVSSQSLGIPRNILLTVANQDTMLLVRDQLATTLDEEDRLRHQGILGNKDIITDPLIRIEKLKVKLRKTLGRYFIAGLRNLKKDFTELHSQAKFLYLELLMSEKEQLLGSELHSATKVTKVDKNFNITGWGIDSQSWKRSIGEYWYDEIGYHIVDVKPMCN